MQKILIFGYSYEDISLKDTLIPLFKELSQKKCAIGIELGTQLFELDEQIEICNVRIQQVETLAEKAFSLSLEQLLSHKTSNTVNAAKPLIRRAKSLSFQQAILRALQITPELSTFGIGTKPDSDAIFHYLVHSNISCSVLFIEKEHLISLKNALKSSKIITEAFWLTSTNYTLSKEIVDSMSNAHIHISTLSTRMHHPQSIATILQKSFQQLEETARLSITMRAIRKEPSSQSANFHPERQIPSKDSDIAQRMKNAMRGIFSDNGLPANTIVGRDNSSDD